jgi:MFS superfamily sulfate permease-like transporter
MFTLQHKVIPAYVSIFRIHGPFLFGATDKIDEITTRLSSLPPILILRLRNMTAIDSTGLQALESLADQVHESGRELILCRAREQPSRLMHQAEFQQHIGPRICATASRKLWAALGRSIVSIFESGELTVDTTSSLGVAMLASTGASGSFGGDSLQFLKL